MGEVLVQAEGLEVNEVPDGYIVYQTAQDQVHFLNSTAALIFEFCNGQHSSADIMERVVKAFDLERDSKAGGEIKSYLQELLDQGLVQLDTN